MSALFDSKLASNLAFCHHIDKRHRYNDARINSDGTKKRNPVVRKVPTNRARARYIAGADGAVLVVYAVFSGLRIIASISSGAGTIISSTIIFYHLLRTNT
jgi:hypothetical protein